MSYSRQLPAVPVGLKLVNSSTEKFFFADSVETPMSPLKKDDFTDSTNNSIKMMGDPTSPAIPEKIADDNCDGGIQPNQIPNLRLRLESEGSSSVYSALEYYDDDTEEDVKDFLKRGFSGISNGTSNGTRSLAKTPSKLAREQE